MFCSGLKQKLRKALRSFDEYVESHVNTALTITTCMRNILQSPVTDLVTALIPGTLDDVAKAKTLQVLCASVDVLSVVKKCSGETDAKKKIQCFMDELKQYDPKLQNTLLFKLASLVTAGLDDNKLSENLYDLYVQAKYVASK